MRRPAFYSSSGRSRTDPSGHGDPAGRDASQTLQPDAALSTYGPARLLRYASVNHLRLLWSVVGLLALLLAISFSFQLQTPGRKLTQKDIDAAVLKTLETKVLPGPGVKAYEAIIPSVVRVVGLGKSSKDKDGDELPERSVGTGVVITDKGIILTNARRNHIAASA